MKPSDVAFTDAVKRAQQRYGVRQKLDRWVAAHPWPVDIPGDLAAFIQARDSVYLGTSSADGRPYVQHRGGPPGFIKVLGPRALALPDFAGNRQYISVGNLYENDRAFLFLMDYASRRRLKLWGRARIVERDEQLLDLVRTPDYPGRVERVLVFRVETWSVNCPQHIVPRFTLEELRRRSGPSGRQRAADRADVAPPKPHGFQIIGQHFLMTALLVDMERVAPTAATVLVEGETGTGKELVAAAIHEMSGVAGPMIKLNCAAIPPHLVESELFGHVMGAFTGATQRRVGRFAEADEGTLFLDEVAELPIDAQAKLLRVLQEGTFEPVGSNRTHTVNVRIIAATNRDLGATVGEGRFRADLYYRLNVYPLKVPPLRERRSDIPLLLEHFLREASRRTGRGELQLTPHARSMLEAHDWPGNVRELQNTIERAIIRASGSTIAAGHLEFTTSPAGLGRSHRLVDIERHHIVRVLDAHRWVIAGAAGSAAALGMAPSTLRSKMKRLGIERPREIS